MFGIASAVKLIQMQPSVSGANFLYNFSFLKTYYNTDISLVISSMSKSALFLQLLPFVFWTVYIVLMVYLVSVASKKPIFTLLCFMGGFATLALLVDSATMFASTNRVFFVCSILLVIIFNQLMIESQLIKSRRFILMLACIFMVTMGIVYFSWIYKGYYILMQNFN